MPTYAILPVKHLEHAKQRLSAALPPPTRRSLVEAMFIDALTALRRCTALDGLIVVTPDHNAQRIAAGYGAEVIADGDAGHNDAARRGIDRACELGADRVLLVPGDCPLLEPAEIDALLDEPADGPSVLVVPDRHGTGTNALVLSPPRALAPSFGEGSHARHLELARAAGIAARTVEVATLAYDVDTGEDLSAVDARLAETRGGAAHTRGMLRQLQRSAASGGGER